MSESDEKNVSAEKSARLASSSSRSAKGVSKIFILTPEILSSLGIKGPMSIRKPSRQERSGEVRDRSATTVPSGKIILEATSGGEKVDESNKKTEKAFDGKERKSSTAEKPEESIDSTPVAKSRRRRKSGSTDTKDEQEKVKTAGQGPKSESKDKLDDTIAELRTPRRVTKPKKFNDYIVEHHFAGKTATEQESLPVSLPKCSKDSEPQSSNETGKNTEKKQTGKLKKCPDVDAKRRSSSHRLSVPFSESQNTPGQTKIDQEHERSRDQTKIRQMDKAKSLEEIGPAIAQDKIVSCTNTKSIGCPKSPVSSGSQIIIKNTQSFTDEKHENKSEKIEISEKQPMVAKKRSIIDEQKINCVESKDRSKVGADRKTENIEKIEPDDPVRTTNTSKNVKIVPRSSKDKIITNLKSPEPKEAPNPEKKLSTSRESRLNSDSSSVTEQNSSKFPGSEEADGSKSLAVKSHRESDATPRFLESPDWEKAMGSSTTKSVCDEKKSNDKKLNSSALRKSTWPDNPKTIIAQKSPSLKNAKNSSFNDIPSGKKEEIPVKKMFNKRSDRSVKSDTAPPMDRSTDKDEQTAGKQPAKCCLEKAIIARNPKKKSLDDKDEIIASENSTKVLDERMLDSSKQGSIEKKSSDASGENDREKTRSNMIVSMNSPKMANKKILNDSPGLNGSPTDKEIMKKSETVVTKSASKKTVRFVTEDAIISQNYPSNPTKSDEKAKYKKEIVVGKAILKCCKKDGGAIDEALKRKGKKGPTRLKLCIEKFPDRDKSPKSEPTEGIRGFNPKKNTEEKRNPLNPVGGSPETASNTSKIKLLKSTEKSHRLLNSSVVTKRCESSPKENLRKSVEKRESTAIAKLDVQQVPKAPEAILETSSNVNSLPALVQSPLDDEKTDANSSNETAIKTGENIDVVSSLNLSWNILDDTLIANDLSVVEEIVETSNEKNEEAEQVPNIQRPIKRGGRRRKCVQIESPMEFEPNDCVVAEKETDMEKELSPSEGNASREKKVLRLSEESTDGKGLSDGEDSLSQEIAEPRKRGRPPCSFKRPQGRPRGGKIGNSRVSDFEYVPRKKSQHVNTNEEETKESDKLQQDESHDASSLGQKPSSATAQEVECGKCKDKMPKRRWAYHNMSKHNDMGWLTGDPKPDWENNEKLLRTVLFAVMKKKKRKGAFTCETCGVEKRSVLGFISHMQFCGKTEEESKALLVSCSICGNVMMPASMEMHERTHRQMNATPKEPRAEQIKPKSTESRGKRKAAEKAATIIAEFGEFMRDDEGPPKKRRRTQAEMLKLVVRTSNGKTPPSQWRITWDAELAKDGSATCRHPNCKFSCDSIESMYEHNANCPCIPRVRFMCKVCSYCDDEEAIVIEHIKAKHAESTAETKDTDFTKESSSSSEYSDSDCSTEKSSTALHRSSKIQYQCTNLRFLDTEVHIDPKASCNYTPAVRWTMEFEEKNFDLRLFDNFLPNTMRLLSTTEALDYFPELEESMQVKEMKSRPGRKSPDWFRWKRFEGGVSDGIPTLFTGGPVWAIAWLPIPAPMYDKSVDQYVAISTHPTMESVYTVGKSYVEKNLIQIWNLGDLNHCNRNYDAPTFSYGIAHNKGTIWCLEWCPSGCYENSDIHETANDRPKRMGLLAAACSDGCVHIFSLPFPQDLETLNNLPENSLPIYETKPAVTLLTSIAMYDKGKQNWQCTKLNWTKEHGHDMIIAGYSNGCIGIWDLNAKSPLFVTRRNDTCFIDAFHHLYAHGHAVSFVHMIPYGGKRFFVSSSYDRVTKIWDLENLCCPSSTVRRRVALDGAWFTHWPVYLTAYDDLVVYNHSYASLLRQTGNKVFPLLPSNSAINSVDVSDYGNSAGQGTEAGDVVVMFPHYLWSFREMDRDTFKKRWLASTAEVVDFSPVEPEEPKQSKTKASSGKVYRYMPAKYEDCKDRFGLQFRDILTRLKRDVGGRKYRPPCSEKMKSVNVEQYSFTSANRVSWNPNPWSFLWLCVGYQNGLVRFLNFNAVSSTNELNKLLPAHGNSMLEKATTPINLN